MSPSRDAFKHISSSSLKEDSFSFIPEIDVSPPLFRFSIEEIYSPSLSFFEQKDPSFDVEPIEDHSTIEWILSKDCKELYDRSRMRIMILHFGFLHL